MIRVLIFYYGIGTKMNIPALWAKASKLFGENFPIFTDQTSEREVMKSFEYSLPTAVAEKPFVITGNLVKGGEICNYQVTIETNDVRHPHGSHICNTSHDNNKNPALLSALWILRNAAPSAVKRSMKEAGISQRSMGVHEVGNIGFANSSHGIYMWLNFNPTDKYKFERPVDYRPMTSRQAVRFFDELELCIQALLPHIQKTIDDQKHLQPDVNNQIAAMEHLANLQTDRVTSLAGIGNPEGDVRFGFVAEDMEEARDLGALAQSVGVDEPIVAVAKGGKIDLFKALKL